MEWPKKKPQNKETPLAFDGTFDNKFQKLTNESIESERTLEDVSTPNELIEAVDFKALDDIFRSLLTKGDSDKKDLYKIIHPSDVHINTEDSSESMGSFSFEDGIILNWRALVTTAKTYRGNMQSVELEVPDHSLLGVLALQTLIHEELHRISRTRIKLSDEIDSLEDPQGAQVIKGFTQNELFVSLDEAVTEQIAQEIFESYLHRTGTRNALYNKERAFIGISHYTLDRVVVHKLIDAISTKIGMPRDQVWRGFVQEYLNGDELPLALLQNIADELSSNPEYELLLNVLKSDHQAESEGEVTFDKLFDNEVIEKMVPNIIPENFSDALGIR